MAKKQRGKTTSQSKTANNEKQEENFTLMLESSDDEAPEEVTFEDSKAQALRSMKRALDTARREKELLKEKRRKRQELFQEQKKRKLLPDDLLEEIDSASSKKQKQSEDEAEEERQEDDEEESRKKKKKRSGKLVHARNLKGNYTVATVKEERASASFQQQAAKDFIQSRLYGPGSCRTTSNELLSLQNKKGRNKSAAVQFVKKDWACKEKAKAEKLKKRWVHKQQIPSC
ncbi:nucleolar protein 7 [Seriola lalandi dorsalis]|uniref:nucleolar protein 7 n=1 Tax=Seriola lalandi dorsalis TaxID=1841481 RepID=UPI000C6FC214|nr:nucleolar protein 7 [Seriola lalandi dorsalis]XP_056246785.1 nucleolar protein 7 [Seriola aureovittata]